MPIQGNLKTLSFAELLSIVQQLKKSGVLHLVSGMEERGLLIQGGNIVYATSQDPGRRIGSFLVQLGILSPEEVHAAAASEEGTEVYFGERLVDCGKITRDELRQAVKWQVLDVAEEVIGWSEGAFYFDENELPFAVPSGNPISTHSILLEATRRVDEKRLIQKLFPDATLVLQRARSISAPPSRPEIGAILESVDGKSTVESILLKAGDNARQAAEILRALLDQGALTVVPEAGAVEDGSLRRDPVCFPVSPDLPGRVFSAFTLDASPLDVIGDVVEDDPILAAKMLRRAAKRRPDILRGKPSIGSVVHELGTLELREILVPEAIRGLFLPSAQHYWQDWWVHSRAVARAARSIAVTIGYPAPEEAYLAGLLHNFGAFVLLSIDPQRYRTVVLDAARREKSLLDIEQGVYGISHPEIGADCGEQWGFPAQIVAAIRQHHHGGNGHPLVDIVTAADGVARSTGLQVECIPSWEDPYSAALTKLGLPRRKAASLLSLAPRSSTAKPTRSTNFSY